MNALQIQQAGECPASEREWIRVLLKEWGGWILSDRNLPANQCLRTGGGRDPDRNVSAEKTHQAALYLRKLSFRHYRLLEKLYSPQRPVKEVYKELAPEWGWKKPGNLSDERKWAEEKVASYRRALDNN